MLNHLNSDTLLEIIIFALLLAERTVAVTRSKNPIEPNMMVVFEQPNSYCHREGKVTFCTTPLTNVAEGVPVLATSTCGERNQSEQYCRELKVDPLRHTETRCELCNEQHDSSRLTDRQQTNNVTYWVSGPVGTGEAVNLTISLGKRFEIYYISLQPYGDLPDSIALYKSADFGATWKPWHYFSSDCYRAFRLPTSDQHTAQISLANIQEVLCVALKTSGGHGSTPDVVAFNTMFRRPATQPWSSALIEWMTMTDLRVSLQRFPTHLDTLQQDTNGLLLRPNIWNPTNVFHFGDANHAKENIGTWGMSRASFQADASPLHSFKSDKTVRFAFSDIAIGGRCKCNGHANKCVREKLPGSKYGGTEWGSLRCDCQHNTAGADCERCASGYLDRPWARATTETANECKRKLNLLSDT